MRRLRLADYRLSRGPATVGLCQGDVNGCARILNAAQERLLYAKETSDEGWNGTWAEMVFAVDRHSPYITCPRGVARLEAIDVCDRPVPLYNQFHEYMLFGNGRMPKGNRWHGKWNCLTAGYTRNNAVTFVDLQDPPQLLQYYCTNTADYGKRIMAGGLDSNGSLIWTQDGTNTVQGEFTTFAAPFATSVNEFSQIQGIQKDVTEGQVQVFQVDPLWGSMELLLTMEPTETTASYRRYYLNHLPHGCCNHNRFYLPTKSPTDCGCPHPKKEWALVTALAALDLIPVVSDTDYCLIQNLEALIEECRSVYFSEMNTAEAQKQSLVCHQNAIRLLIGELAHFQGKNTPSVNFAPFGSARLERLNISMR